MLGFAGLVMWVATDLGSPPFVAAVVLELAFASRPGPKWNGSFKSLSRRSHDLVLIAELLARLETETFTTPMLAKLAESSAVPAVNRLLVRVARLARLLDLIDSGENQFFAPFAVLCFGRRNSPGALTPVRRTPDPEIAGWLSSVGEFEALESLAAFAFENPGDPFPEIDDGPGSL